MDPDREEIMNILYISQFAGSAEMGRVDRPYYMALRWQERGHRVAVVAASFSLLRTRNPVVESGVDQAEADGVEYYFLRTPAHSGSGPGWARNTGAFMRRLRHAARQLAREFRPDVVIAGSTHPLDFASAEKIAGESGALLVYELYTLWLLPSTALNGYSPLHPAVLAMQSAERRALARAAQIVSILPNTDRYIQKRGFVTQGRFVHIPVGVPLVSAAPVERAHRHLACLQRHRDRGKLIVLYCGSLRKAYSLETFVRAAKLLENDGVQFVTVGGGDCKDALWEQASREEVRNITFCSTVPKEQVPEILELADVLYVGAQNSPLNRYGVGMNKLLDYMAAAKPVIYGVEGADNPVRSAGCGLTIPARDECAMAKAVRVLKAMPEERRRQMGENGKRYVRERHNYQKLADLFLNCMEEGVEVFRQESAR